jgi:hypothetical protein
VGVTRKIVAPDRREWVVQLVWWPRPTEGSRQSERFLSGRTRSNRNAGPIGGILFDAVHILVWPLIFLLKIAFRRPWLIEAFIPNGPAMDGMAWKVRGLRAGRAVVDEVADAIGSGTRRPSPAGATPAQYIPKYRPSTGIY